MKKFKRILLGALLVLIGAILALNALEITNIKIFFDGWWTLFIIVPCFINLFTERDKVGNLCGIGLGAVLLLCCQGILDFSVFWKLILPIAIIGTGLSMIFSGIFLHRKMKSDFKKLGLDGEHIKVNYAVFSGADIDCGGEVFDGASLCAVFGGVDMDLRGAIIEKDCTILATVAFGAIEILVPKDVNVQINSAVSFGSIDNNCQRQFIENAPTLYINCKGSFGSIDISTGEDDD